MIGGSTGIAQSTKQIHGRSALSYKLEITIKKIYRQPDGKR
jgi:hypothetical protein